MRISTKSQGIMYAALFAAILLLASCSSSSSRPGGSGKAGSVSFSLQMAGQSASAQVYKAASIACDELGIVSVEAYVYDEYNNLLASGGPWECNSGGGMIYAVKVGSNRSVLVLLRGADHSVRYRGSVRGITIRAGETTDVGIIDIVPEEEDNLPPEASGDQAIVYQGGVVSVLDSGAARLTANDFDPEGKTLTVSTSPVSGPSHGSLTLRADGTFLYTHDGSAPSTDSFTYRVSDPDGLSSTATAIITVLPYGPNQEPVLSGGLVSPEKGLASAPYAYTVTYKDPEGNAPEHVSVVVDGVSHAMSLFSGSAGNGVYRYQASMALGEHSYYFTCNDGHGGSARYPAADSYTGPSVVTEDHTPIASDDHAVVYRGGVVYVLGSGSPSLLANDSAALGLTLSMATAPVRPPAHGSLQLFANGRFRYTHDGSPDTFDSFSYRIYDSMGHTDIATVSFEVDDRSNTAPVMSEYNASPGSGDTSTLFAFSIHYFDTDGNAPADVSIVVDGASHAMTLVSGTPADGVYAYQTSLSTGSHSLSFTGDDGHGSEVRMPESGSYSSPDVAPRNMDPLALDDSVVVGRGKTVSVLDTGHRSVLANDSDPEGQPLSVDTAPAAGPLHGTLELHGDGTFSYTHDGGSTTSDSFTYRVTDGHGGEDTAIAYITVRVPSIHEPVLSEPDVSPKTGDVADLFTFSVRYYHPDGDSPATGNVVIDGVPQPMALAKGQGANGTYALKTSLTQGTHHYYFSFGDSHGSLCRYPASGSLTGPRVLASMQRFYVVPAPLGSDGNDGSAAHPFATIGHALAAAHGTPENPAGIRVAAGIYQESITAIPWVCLEGGWDAGFTKRWDFGVDGLTPAAGYRTVIASAELRCITISGVEGVSVEGFTVRGSQPPLSTTGVSGILIHACSPVIRYCIIEGNLGQGGATSAGAGMLIDSGSPLVRDCSFINNWASGSELNFGGALYMGNAAPSILSCAFIQNHAGCITGAGGAVYSYRSTPLIQGCFFDENSTCGRYCMGGAIYNKESSPQIVGCVFISNKATGEEYGSGGAIFNESSSPVITNCTFSLNSAESCSYASGGAMFSDNPSAPAAANCIFWNDSAELFPEIGGAAAMTFSDINQDGFDAGGNIRLDPLFVDPDDINLMLLPGSPCIDAGSADATGLPSVDIKGLPRILNGIPDMGAYEGSG